MATVTSSKRQLTHTSNTYESNGDVTIGGNLNINGTTTTIDTANLLVEDKNIIIGDVTSPSDSTADGGGITLKGTTDKTLIWVDSTDAWTFNQNVNASGFIHTDSNLSATGNLETNGTFTLHTISAQNSENTALVINGSGVVGTRELGSNAFNSTSFAAASHTHSASDITSGTLNGSRLPRPVNGDWWNGGAVIVGTDGVMEVGKYLDFHTADSGGGTDYDVRVTASSSAISVGGSVTATSFIKSGGTTNQFLKANGNVDGTAYAPLASPALTGSPTAPTPSLSDNNTNIATTEYVKSQGYITSADGGNAGTLDGIDSSAFLRSNASDTATGQLTFSGNIIATEGLFGAVGSAAPDRRIWSVSTSYNDWGIFYNEGSPDAIEFKSGGTATAKINLDDGKIYAEGSNRVFHDSYHPNADTLTTARTIALSGAVTGSASFNGGSNITIATTATADPTLTLSGDASGSATFTNLGNATLSVTVANDSHTHDSRYYTETEVANHFKTLAVQGNFMNTYSWSGDTVGSANNGWSDFGSSPFSGNGTYGQNGTNAENTRAISTLPNGAKGVVWQTPSNDSTSDGDGGWNCDINGVDSTKSYRSVIYFRKTDDSNNGQFYHGCNGSHTLNINGTANTNPYFQSPAISTFVQDRWYVSIGYIQAYQSSGAVTGGQSGVYDCTTGKLVSAGADMMMKDGSTTQTHRVYLYYSTDPATSVEFYAPRFEELNGNEPSKQELVNKGLDGLDAMSFHSKYDPEALTQLTESSDANDDKFLLWDESASVWKYMRLDDLQDSIDNNTTYSAGTGLSLSGTTFSLTDTASKLSLSGGTMSGNIAMGNNNITGVNNIQANGDISLQTSTGEYALYGSANAQTQLYHNGIKKFETTSGGVEVTGIISATGGNSTNWNTAYGWGNHASAGYVTTDTNTTYSAGTGISLSGTTFSLTDTASKLSLSGGTLTGTLNSRDIKLGSGYHLMRSNHHSGHLEGSYNNVGANAGKSNPIYTIGSGYNPTDAALSNMYGIGYSHTDASFISFTGASGWGQYVAADGDARIFLCGSNGVISSTGEHYVGSNRVFHAGYHPNADTLTTARTISLAGDVTGSVSFNGSSNVSITTVVGNDSHTHDSRYYTETETDQFLALKATIASPAFTGNPTAPTQAANNNSTRIATTAYVQTELADLIGGAPAALDTLNELAAAIGDDASYASSITTALAAKAPLASPALTGAVTVTGSGSSGNAFEVNRGSDSAQALRIQNTGEVVVDSNYLYAAASGTSLYVQNSAVFRGSISNDASGQPVTIGDDLYVSGDLTIGSGSSQSNLHIKKADNDVSDHIVFYNGTTRIGEIGAEDTTWLRINQETAKNIYTPRYIRADGGFFVDGASRGIDGSGNFIGGTITGASDANVSNWNTAYGWGNHASAGYVTSSGNTIIGTDADITTSNAEVVNNIYMTDGVITSHTKRTLTLANLGYTGATNANNYSLPEATATSRGGIELFSNTDQSVAANSVSATSGRTYGIQLNSAGQAVVNVPWSDTNTDTNTTYTAGSGLTLSGTEFSHADTSSQSSSANSGRTYIQSLNLDGQGHVTGLTTATETVVNTDTNTTYSAGRGLDLSGTEFQLETDLRDSISYIGYDSNDYLQWSNNSYVRAVVSGTERFRVNTSGIDVNGTATASGFQTDTTNTNYNLISRNGTSFTLYVQAAQSNSTQPIASFRYGSATANGGTETFRIRKDNVNVFGANFTVGGSITGNSKNFSIPHPTKEGKRLVHSCLEGPEIGVYFRGRSTSATIEMPDYWAGLVHLDSMTIELTAIGPNQDLYVEDIADDGDVTVGSNTETALNYFYVVYGERKDLERLEVEIEDTVEVEESNDNLGEFEE